MKPIKPIAVLLFLLAAIQSVDAKAYSKDAVEYCGKANVENVNEMYSCMTKLMLNPTPNTECGDVKRDIYEARVRYNAEYRNDPSASCAVIAKVIERFAGSKPSWAPCIDYDGSESAISNCIATGLGDLRYKKNYYEGQVLPCHLAQSTLKFYAGKAGHRFSSSADLPSCEMLNNALKTHGEEIVHIGCINYQPNSEKHVSHCLSDLKKSDLKAPKAADCPSLREIYKGRAISVSEIPGTGLPKGYESPGCDLFEPTLARLNSVNPDPVVTTTPPVQAPTPIQQPQHVPPQPQSQPQPVVTTPVVTTPAPAPIAQPARQPVQSSPMPQPAAVVTNSPSAPQETSEQRRERKAEEKMEKMEKVQTGLNTVNQVMGLFGGGAGNATTNQTTANQTAATETPPPEQETKDERKTKETTDTINQAAETINTLKGLFGK